MLTVIYTYVIIFLDHESLESGFTCPSVSNPQDAFGLSDPHPKYADPSDCAKFYICLNGVTPREQGCELGLVYNEQSLSCDSPKNVPEWYGHKFYFQTSFITDYTRPFRFQIKGIYYAPCSKPKKILYISNVR